MDNFSRKPRKHHHRFNPHGLEEEMEEYKENLNQSIDEDEFAEPSSLIQKIQSFDPTIREMATISLAQIEGFSDDILTELYNSGVFKTLVQRLVDPNPQIVLNSLMALMNIIDSNGEAKEKGIGQVMIEAGIMTILDSILSNFKEAHESKSINSDDPNFNTKLAIIDNIYRLLSSLAEVIDQEHINSFLESNSTKVAIYFLTNSDEPHILTGIASYMHVLAEFSVELCQQMSKNVDFLKRILEILGKQYCTQELKAYLLGTLFNYVRTSEKHNLEVPDKVQLAEKVLEQILDVVSIDIFSEVEQLLHILKPQEVPKNDENQENPLKQDLQTNDENEKEVEEYCTPTQDINFREAQKIWNDTAIAIEICMGILINMFESDDEKEEWGDEDEDEYDEKDVDQSKKNEYQPINSVFLQNLNVEAKFKVLKLLGDKVKHLSPEVTKILNDYNLRSIIDQSHSLIQFAFSCMLNLSQNIEYQQGQSEQKPINQVANDIFKHCWDEMKFYLENIYQYESAGNEDNIDKEDTQQISFDQEIVVDILKILIFLIHKVSNVDLAQYVGVDQFLKVNAGVFDKLPLQAKTMLIEMLGARCHPKFKISKEENAAVADHFITLLKSDDVMIIGEALNALFDVYSDEDYDDVFVQKGLFQVLEYGYEVFKKKINENKKVLPKEDIGLLKNHLLNLKRFLQYKKEHI